MPKLYEVWPGTNRFCCNYCITGPRSDLAANSYWYICALLVVVIYSIFITGRVWTNATPALPIIFYLSVIVTTLFLNLTACSDPGIIPRKSILEFYGP